MSTVLWQQRISQVRRNVIACEMYRHVGESAANYCVPTQAAALQLQHTLL